VALYSQHTMFALHDVALRPLEPEDIDTLYRWNTDVTLEMLAGWGPRLSRSAFRTRQERRMAETREDLETFGVTFEERLVGYVQLALIDLSERRAACGIVLGDETVRGRGVGSIAIRLLLDYAFTVRNLERVYAESYGFNGRAHRLFESVGFQREGILRGHEIHNGARQDMHVFGMLKGEFYGRYESIFQPPQ
jgi:RimJ/RimL family protein N-acetyltransferase